MDSIKDNVKINRSDPIFHVLCHAVGVSCDKDKDFKRVLLALKPKDSNAVDRKLVLIQLLKDEFKDKKNLVTDAQPVNDKFSALENLKVDLPSQYREPVIFLLTTSPENISTDAVSFEELQSEELPMKPGKYLVPVFYRNLTLEQALKIYLPDCIQPISGFTIMSHLAHFNLKPQALLYKQLIGEIVLDKVPNVRTVIHKAANIDSTYRTFKLDLMAGEEEYVTSVKENGCIFKFDFSKVYWNSRLGTEHTRVVEFISKETVSSKTYVFDIFAGIGPFSIPLARLNKVTKVWANDLNPHSYEWLEHNKALNSSKKKPLNTLHTFNKDGREFVKEVVLPQLLQILSQSEKKQNVKAFVLMNLPALAPDFLDAFRKENLGISLIEASNLDLEFSLNFFCYCFHKTNSAPQEEMLDRVLEALNLSKSESELVVKSWNPRFVRNVAPYKDMYCLQFQLDLRALEVVSEVPPKKQPKLQ
ncbi:tRNA (guanine(37)-N1)-methyltransferase [Cichlidogyrus casuarinus]|uniref:tRNA (guanine(37)-N1)-methyltransferase n=1 Tax=Cichlidogyrus casuarinus TaxID=1844966 RepID=A0ABD2QQE9_9PLAT